MVYRLTADASKKKFPSDPFLGPSKILRQFSGMLDIYSFDLIIFFKEWSYLLDSISIKFTQIWTVGLKFSGNQNISGQDLVYTPILAERCSGV